MEFLQKCHRRIVAVCMMTLCWSAWTAASEPANGAGDDVIPSFLKRLRVITDDGGLFDINATSKGLGISLREARTMPTPGLDQCTGKERPVGIWRTDIVADQESWYRNLPTGVPNVPVPGFLMNHPSRIGDATLRYEIQRATPCGNRPAVIGDKATLQFVGLSSFACITKRDIQRYLPEARPENATDGVSMYRYKGNVGEETGTYMTLMFSSGAECAISAVIEQSQIFGNRFLRAGARYHNCVARADQEACAQHDPASGYNTLLRQLREHSTAVCGVMADFYEREPAQGSMPDAILESGVGSYVLCGRDYR